MKTKKKNSDSEHAFILMFRELKLERFQRQYLLYLLVELMELDEIDLAQMRRVLINDINKECLNTFD
jgi:hypothetical protein